MNTRTRAVVIWLVTLSVFSLIVGIAAAEYKARQTQGVLEVVDRVGLLNRRRVDVRIRGKGV